MDTRAITRRLRDTGALNGVITSDASVRYTAPATLRSSRTHDVQEAEQRSQELGGAPNLDLRSQLLRRGSQTLAASSLLSPASAVQRSGAE